MKKLSILLAIVIMISSCGNNSNTPSNTDSTKPPSDTNKTDTIRPTDSIIKG